MRKSNAEIVLQALKQGRGVHLPFFDSQTGETVEYEIFLERVGPGLYNLGPRLIKNEDYFFIGDMDLSVTGFLAACDRMTDEYITMLGADMVLQDL